MKLRNLLISLFILGIVDSFVTFIFPVDFTFRSLSFVPHIAFMALLLWTYERDGLDRILIGALYGLLYDYFFQSSFPLSFLLFPLFSWGVGMVYRKKEDIFWLSGACMMAVLLLDLLPFLFFRLRGSVQVYFWSWLIHLEFPTMLFQFLVMVILYYSAILMRTSKKKRIAKKRKSKRSV